TSERTANQFVSIASPPLLYIFNIKKAEIGFYSHLRFNLTYGVDYTSSSISSIVVSTTRALLFKTMSPPEDVNAFCAITSSIAASTVSASIGSTGFSSVYFTVLPFAFSKKSSNTFMKSPPFYSFKTVNLPESRSDRFVQSIQVGAVAKKQVLQQLRGAERR